jgi:hypothetical protein
MNSNQCHPDYEPYSKIEEVFVGQRMFRRFRTKNLEWIVICPSCGVLLKKDHYCCVLSPAYFTDVDLYSEIK